MAKGKGIDLKQRCEILAALISGVQEAYLSATEEQKSFIETTIGAALWYLPTIRAGYISIELVKRFQDQKDTKASEEHIYPRKISASELLNMDKSEINAEVILQLYIDKYSKICLITPDENKAAIKYQKKGSFKTPIDVYNQANIQLVTITEKEFQRLKKKDKSVIEVLLARTPITQI